MRQLGIQQTDHMTPGTEGAGFFFNPGFARQLRNQVRRNPLAELTQNRDFRTAWLTFLFFHPCLVAG